MPFANKLNRLVQRIHKTPAFFHQFLLTQLFSRTIKFAGTAGVQVLQLTNQQAKLQLINRKKVQNHIGSVHAAATALLGESASGFLVGMHIPDDRIPLLKSMNISYLKRSTGDLIAKAQLTDDQIAFIAAHDKGEITVKVQITDQLNIAPVDAEFVWAWIPKKAKPA